MTPKREPHILVVDDDLEIRICSERILRVRTSEFHSLQT